MTVIVPFSAADSAMAPAASPRARELVLRVGDVEGVSQAKAAVERRAAARFGPDWGSRLSIAASSTMRLDQARQAIMVFKMVMDVFAGISLVVGSLGIMNILLAVLLGLAGALGVTAAIRASSNAPVYAALSWETIVVAATVSVVVGLAFGTFPALHAARLSPIAAIRHE